jgi:CHAT domain-containing protein
MNDDGLQMEIAADDRMAPFEVVRTRPKDPRSYLGVRCGITRWIGPGKAPMVNPTVAVTSMACIRPDYAEESALPSARAEEAALQQRFGDRVKHMATVDDLAELLDRADVRLIHFAGHADGNPPRLSLEGGGRFPGMRFTRERPLLSEAHPFFFINGCRAGVGRPDAAPILGDFAKLLLRNGCVGVVAPTIKVQSTAALGVAQKFYEQAGSASVAEALRQARALVLGDGRDELAASYLSYVFCGPPELRLQF